MVGRFRKLPPKLEPAPSPPPLGCVAISAEVEDALGPEAAAAFRRRMENVRVARPDGSARWGRVVSTAPTELTIDVPKREVILVPPRHGSYPLAELRALRASQEASLGVVCLQDDPFSAEESAKVAKDAVEQFWKERSR